MLLHVALIHALTSGELLFRIPCGGGHLVKVATVQSDGFVGPTDTKSHVDASDICQKHGGGLVVTTNDNTQCIVENARHGKKLRLPVHSASISTPLITHQGGGCSFLFEDKNRYHQECGVTGIMRDQNDYILCEIDAPDPTRPLLEPCSTHYDLCGVCNGEVRSCSDCASQCLTGNVPENNPVLSASGGGGGEQWHANASFIAPVAALSVIIVLVTLYFKNKRNSTNQETPVKLPNVSFVNPDYLPPDDADGYMIPNSDSGKPPKHNYAYDMAQEGINVEPTVDGEYDMAQNGSSEVEPDVDNEYDMAQDGVCADNDYSPYLPRIDEENGREYDMATDSSSVCIGSSESDATSEEEVIEVNELKI